MRNLSLLFLALKFLTPVLYAESHREPSVLPTARAVEDLQVIREDGFLYSKELVRDGIRTTVRGGGSSVTHDAKTLSDFVGKKSCGTDNEAMLIVAYTSGSMNKAVAGCQDQLDGRVILRDSQNHTLLCKYSCQNTNLDSLQSLFFESYVRYIEPNASRTLN